MERQNQKLPTILNQQLAPPLRHFQTAPDHAPIVRRNISYTTTPPLHAPLQAKDPRHVEIFDKRSVGSGLS